MKIEEKIDILYPSPLLRMDEMFLGADLSESLQELKKGEWSNIRLEDYELLILVELYYNLIYDNKTLYRDYWRNAIKIEIYKKINNSRPLEAENHKE